MNPCEAVQEDREACEPEPVQVAEPDQPARVKLADVRDRGQVFQAMRESLKTGVQVAVAPQLFPTPPALAARMVEAAELGSTFPERILEPSAGTGAIIDAIKARKRYADGVMAVEINPGLADGIRRRFDIAVKTGDFLEQPQEPKFHRVIMNPPFSDGADMAHVRHAFGFLRPGGRLVAIMGEGAFFRMDRRAVAFRAWLESVGGTSEKLPAGSFEASGTGVNTRLVVIDRAPEGGGGSEGGILADAGEPAAPLDMRALPVRRVSIECIDHPEWGTFGVMDDHGEWYDIHGRGGSRVLFKSEAVQLWRVAK